MAYTRKTDEELKVIARDLFGGIIFTDRHCNGDPDKVRMAFTVLALADQKTIQSIKDDKIALLYEYLSEAGPRSCNGLPCFMSMRCLDQEDTARMFAYYDKYKEFEASI